MTTAVGLSSAETVALFKQHVIANYNRYPVNLVRGEGSLVWDSEGKRLLFGAENGDAGQLTLPV